MNTILDYIDWRGDLSWQESAFNEIDSLIFSQLSYLDFSSIVSPSFTEPRSLSDVAEAFAAAPDFEKRKNLGTAINADTVTLLFAAGHSRRFASVQMCGYIVHTDPVQEKQFAAVTFCFGKEKTLYIAFRGTDGTLVGWKEDFNMAFLSPVPAQLDAVSYAESAAQKKGGNIILGGHSKGGNLAVYAAACCNKKTKKRIKAIYNNDGPGFDADVLRRPEFAEIIPLINTFMPKSSIVGILFDHKEKCVFVESSEKGGILQHDPFSWFVVGTSFVTVSSLTADSIFFDCTIKEWLQQLSTKQRELFIDTLFSVVQATDAKSLSDLSVNWIQKSGAVLRAMSQIDDDTKKNVLRTLHLLLKTAKKSIPVLSELFPNKRDIIFSE